jgi:hypothetical protein
MALPVVLEVAGKRSFASALEWPGWSRSGRTPDEAIERLVEYAPRYARVARRAKISFRIPDSVDDIEVAQRVRGDGGTDFGVPGKPAKAENEPMTPKDVERAVALLRASWAAFDAAARAAEGVRLAVGPRGGGRPRSKIIEHVREAEVAYLWKLGGRAPSASDEPPKQPMKRLHATVVETLTAVAGGTEPSNPSGARKRWPPRYAVRRSAWHVLDHAWELEDRSA